MFDGKIARAMKRTEDEKKFGIQIDSLCDLICFGVFPAIIVYSLGATDIFGVICITLYVLGAVIRLGFFNVMEEKRQKETTEDRKVYQGLPVTSVSILYPIVFLLGRHMIHRGNLFVPFLEGVTLLIAILFVLNIKIKKPNKQASYAMLGFGAIILLKVLGVFKWFR
jgi:CDP-diacylglycerol--serine O-phosphatidyltransferase